MSLRALLQERAAVRDRLVALHDKSDGPLSDLEQRQWDEACVKIADIESRIKRLAALDEFDRAVTVRPTPMELNS
jgi:hypothetical protein